ncbi:MAG: DUF1015 domain-containing protein [Rhodothermaceae bacterium]|nr:DUF1015 domain-containing protein [Rhodothermaceae bacterium]MYG69446.1 DUF1015 domain-containing protein [Rhodothermaceae bacterium]MYJ44490.1 DUF1015 domain-containing protein [Rhodothermaceae bacterium]
MAIIKAFAALRPTSDTAESVACVPYDVISVAEARELARGNPKSFLHIIRPEIDLDPSIDEYDTAVYLQGAKNLRHFASGEYSHQETEPSLYAYRIRMDEHEQVGIYGLVSVEEYKRGTILKHENIRPPKVADRTRHIVTQAAHAEPVNLVFKEHAPVMDLMDACTKTEPLFDFTAKDGIQHTVWRFADPERLVEAFEGVDPIYIADGHHRCEAAWKAWDQEGASGSDFFPAVCFPAGSTQILPYNRVIRVQNAAKLIQEIDGIGAIQKSTAKATPSVRGEVSLYADGAWHTVTLPPTRRSGVADQLDVARLGEFVLEPFLGITDQRTDPNITFVGGIRGTDELVERVEESEHSAVAFSMFATSMDQLLAVSDARELMPPKSTWFEPKLRSGLLIHRFAG